MRAVFKARGKNRDAGGEAAKGVAESERIEVLISSD
jgi:hypothetical protein